MALVRAAKTPVGSLVEATLRWAKLTNSLDWACETYAFHEENSVIKVFSEALEKKGVALPLKFFECLKKNIGLSNDIFPMTINIPTRTECIKIYQQSYKEALGGTVSSKVQRQIKNVLKEMEHDRRDEYKLRRKGMSPTI